jgi:hypothetical protein
MEGAYSMREKDKKYTLKSCQKTWREDIIWYTYVRRGDIIKWMLKCDIWEWIWFNRLGRKV